MNFLKKNSFSHLFDMENTSKCCYDGKEKQSNEKSLQYLKYFYCALMIEKVSNLLIMSFL